MFLNWLRSVQAAPGPAEEEEASTVVERSSPGLGRALARIFGKQGQPEVLDLGQPGGSPAVHLADRGARVCVENFELPALPARPVAVAPAPAPSVRRLSIDQPDEKFDLVLAWENADFVPPDRLAEFGAELRRVMAPGAWLVLYAREVLHVNGCVNGAGVREDRPAAYRLVADDRVVRSPGKGPSRARWSYSTRAIEQALSPMAVQGIHLQRDGTREFLARRSPR